MFTLKQVVDALASEPKYRINQALKVVYAQAIFDWNEATILSKDLRQKLNEECSLDLFAQVEHSSDKKTVKAGIDLNGDIVETVLMRHADRNTVCVSSQVGCALNCDFCLTGKSGFKRNLSADEIVNQVLFFSRLLKKEKQVVTNVVFMGMGEPFLNYDNVILALKRLNDPALFNIGARRLSVSTCGVVPGIKQFSKEPFQFNLSVSIHAANDELRTKLMPINKKYPLIQLLKSVRDYIDLTKRKVMLEYTLLKGVNDKPEQALELASLLREALGELYIVNLIYYNSTGGYQPTDLKTAEEFKRVLEKRGVPTIERFRFGRGLKAACGQLARRS